jgi:hypothetical protein
MIIKIEGNIKENKTAKDLNTVKAFLMNTALTCAQKL